MEIRGETIEYSATKKRMRNARSRFLNAEIVKLESKLQDNIDEINLMVLLKTQPLDAKLYTCMEGERNTCTVRYILLLIIEGKEKKD